MVQSLQPKGREFESMYFLVFFLFCFVLFCFLFFFLYFYLYSIRLTSFIIDVPGSLMRNAYTEPVCLEHLRASK